MWISADRNAEEASTEADERAGQLRRAIYALLALLVLGSATGRIAAVNSVDRIALEQHLSREGKLKAPLQRPFLSANDRSRWCTIRALVEQGTYAIDDIIQQPGWDTIDMVKHDGHLYSSKPPLLPTLLAGEYWLIHRLTGATLASHPFAIGRAMLWALNVPALLVVLWVVANLAERFGVTDWGRVFTVATAAFGTFLTSFVTTLNNHLVAAAAAAVSLWALANLWTSESGRRRDFALAGLAAALAAANELPALAWAAAVAALLAMCDWRRTLQWALPPAMVVAAGFFGTNYAAHGSLAPAYAHRGEGENWYDYTYTVNGRERQSYWTNRAGIDLGEPDPARYALHVMVGHHGVFSLTPVWLLTLVGWLAMLFRRDAPLRSVVAAIAVVSIVCVAFFLARPLIDRNYGGMTSGFRWGFWLTPLWTVCLLGVADWLAEGPRLGRWLAGLLLAISTLSASYPTWNPWTHPWLLDFGAWLGWWSMP